MAGAEEVLAALAARRLRAHFRRSSSTSAASSAPSRPASARCTTRSARPTAFNLRNANASVEEGVAGALAVVAAAKAAGHPGLGHDQRRVRLPVRGGASIPVASLDLVERVAAAAPDEVVLADTIGVATPGRVAASRPRRRAASRRDGRRPTSTTPAAPASRTPGPRSRRAPSRSTASVGGIGGCPFAPRATGNIATEDLRLHARGRRHRDRRRPRRPDRRRRLAREACSAGRSRARSTARARSLRPRPERPVLPRQVAGGLVQGTVPWTRPKRTRPSGAA